MKKYILGFIVLLAILILFFATKSNAQVKKPLFKRANVESIRIYYNETQFVTKFTDKTTDCFIYFETISCVKQ